VAKTPTDIRSLARSHTDSALRTLANIMSSEEAPAAARVSAAQALLDRGWGKATQTIEATIDDKRDAADWSRAELVSFIHDATKGSERAAKANGRDREPDSVH
jgi:hypothetical protein